MLKSIAVLVRFPICPVKMLYKYTIRKAVTPCPDLWPTVALSLNGYICQSQTTSMIHQQWPALFLNYIQIKGWARPADWLAWKYCGNGVKTSLHTRYAILHCPGQNTVCVCRCVHFMYMYQEWQSSHRNLEEIILSCTAHFTFEGFDPSKALSDIVHVAKSILYP